MWQDVQPCPAMYSSSLLLNTNECHNVSFQLIISNGRFALAVRGGRGESGLSLMFPHVGHAGVARGGGVLEFLLCPQSRPALDEWRGEITISHPLPVCCWDSYITLSDIICWAFLQVLFCNKLGDLHLHSSEKEDIKINCDSSASHSA